MDRNSGGVAKERIGSLCLSMSCLVLCVVFDVLCDVLFFYIISFLGQNERLKKDTVETFISISTIMLDARIYYT